MKVTKSDGTICFKEDFDLSLEEPSYWGMMDLEELTLENKELLWDFLHHPAIDHIFATQGIVIGFNITRRRDTEYWLTTEDAKIKNAEYHIERIKLLKERSKNGEQRS